MTPLVETETIVDAIKAFQRLGGHQYIAPRRKSQLEPDPAPHSLFDVDAWPRPVRLGVAARDLVCRY